MTRKNNEKYWKKRKKLLKKLLKQKKYLFRNGMQKSTSIDFDKFFKNLGFRFSKLKSFRLKQLHILNSRNVADAWFAGFFLGDGSIEGKTQKGRLNLAKKEIHLLRFICKHFGFPRRRVKNYGRTCRVNFSKKFIMRLSQVFQISQKKSYGVVSFPHFLGIPQIKAFLLGLLYADGNVRIQQKPGADKFAVRFLQSHNFCKEFLLWIQQNTGFYHHYNHKSIAIIPTSTPNYDLACLELAGIDSVKFVRWLLEDTDGKIPILERKLKVLLSVNVTKVKVVRKVPVQQRFTNRQKRAWTDAEINSMEAYMAQNPTHTDEMIGKHIGRTARAVQHQRKALGINRVTTQFVKTPNIPYSEKEINCIQETLKNCPDRNAEVLLDLVDRLNKLACNAGKKQRTIRGVRSFIQKHCDNQKPN